MKKYSNKSIENNLVNEKMKRFNSIKKLYNDGKINKTSSELALFLEDYPNDYFALFLYGKIKMSLGDLTSAKEIFITISESNSNNKYSAMSRLGEIASLEGNISLARKYYKLVLENSPNNEKFTLLKWEKMERRNNYYEKALYVLSYYKGYDPDIEIEKIKIYSLIKDTIKRDEILSKLKEYAKINKENRKLMLEIGRIEKLCGDRKKADSYFKEAKDNKKDNLYIIALYDEMVNLLKLNRYDDTLRKADELCLLDSGFLDKILLIKGICYQGLKEYDEAIKYFTNSLTSKDEEVKRSASYYLGNFMFARGEFDYAEELFKNSIKEYGEYHESSFFKLLALYIKENRFLDALSVLDKIGIDFPKERTDFGYGLCRKLIHKMMGEKINSIGSVYLEKQIISYDKDLAIKHIIEHHTKDKKDNKDKSIFFSNIDIISLYEYVQDLISFEKVIQEDVLDIYSFDFENVGFDKNGPINKVRVITLPNTKDIITMYPSNQDFLPRKCDIVKLTPKRLSRIDKFNERLAKKNIK